MTPTTRDRALLVAVATIAASTIAAAFMLVIAAYSGRLSDGTALLVGAVMLVIIAATATFLYQGRVTRDAVEANRKALAEIREEIRTLRVSAAMVDIADRMDNLDGHNGDNLVRITSRANNRI